MPIIKFFDIKRLKPFHRQRSRVPDPTPDIEEKVAALDPDLKPDEHAYVNHYLGYADILLHEPHEPVTATPEFPDNVTAMPKRAEEEAPAPPDEENGKAA
ncbi:MAG TPA: hypothetical protein VJA94_14015 [Candidatus Angelobacter sp.]